MSRERVAVAGRLMLTALGLIAAAFMAAALILGVTEAFSRPPVPTAVPDMPTGFVGYCTPYGHRLYVAPASGHISAVEDPYCAAKLDDQ